METSKLNDLKLKISYQKEEENYSEQHSVIVNIINKNVKDIKNTLKQAGFSRKDKLTISNYDDNFISIEVADYFREKPTIDDVANCVKELNKDLKIVQNFDVELLYNFMEGEFTLEELADILADEDHDIRDELLNLLDLNFGSEYYPRIKCFVRDMLDVLSNEEFKNILNNYICTEFIDLDEVIYMFGNCIKSHNEKEILLYILSKHYSLKEIIEKYEQYKEGQAQE